MKSLKYFLIAIVLLSGLLFYECSDKFIDLKPLASASEETFYTTMEAADMATTVCYSVFSIEKIWDLSIVMAMGSCASDEAWAGGRDYEDVPEFTAIDQMVHNSNTPNVFEWSYGYLFRAIGYCNVAIEKLPDPIIAQDPAYDEELISRHIGEAYFLRAFNFFTLCQIFGGVPKVDHVLMPSEYNMKRSSIKEIYDLIKSDLKIAVDRLPTKTEWGTNNVGRASKGAAMAMLAKVYLYESSYAKYMSDDYRFDGLIEKWDSVNYWAEKVIAVGEYGLVGLDGERFDSWRDTTNGVGGYYHIFAPEANNSPEEIFSIQSRQDGLGWFYSRGTSLIRWCAPRFSNTPGSGASGEEVPGWGWWSPSDYLVSQFETGDIRYKATVLEEEDSFLLASTNGDIWVTPNYANMMAAMQLHRNQRKYECSPEEYWSRTSDWKDGPTNVKMIRYADLLLMNAEAYMERGGMNDQALTNINLVRERARMSSNTGVPAALTGTLTHDQLERERVVELACEGHRFWDVVRWGVAEDRIDITHTDGTVVDYVTGKNEFFPIPESQILVSDALEQNDGY
jgi:starch-binding outer membrane protein, SusD/RagB family